MREVIYILDFIRTGKFGSVEIGQSINEVRRNFYKPDDISYMGHNMFIWRYGVFEFHFSDGILFLLWCDHLDFMFSPRKKQFKLDRWILDKYRKLTLRKFIEAIESEKINYTLEGTFYNSEIKPHNVIIRIVSTNVCVYFEDYDGVESNIYEYALIAIGSSTLKSNYKVRPL